ncbi:MAG TPA: hypothetical protein VFF67_02485 [Thermoplasmata archaeon]|nr:hypothetical protein [Thermoplasmata archaeon]
MERGTGKVGTSNRRGRWTLRGGGAAVAVAMIFVLSPLASAGTLKAPFTGVANTLYSLQNYNCNGHAKLTTPPSWNHTTGAAAGAGTASQKACPGVSFASSSVELMVGFLGGNFKVAKNASHTLSINWTVAVSGVMSVVNNTKCNSTGGGRPTNYCNEAFIYAFDEGYIRDATNQSYWYAPGYIVFLLQNYTFSPTTRTTTVAYSYNFYTIWSITLNLVAGHHYQFGWQFYALADTFVSPNGNGVAQGSATISMSLAGSGLNSLTI